MKTGPKGGRLNILSDDEVQRVHEAALALLQSPGIQSESDLFLDIFAKGGAIVERDDRSIRIPPEMVEAALATVPSSFVLHARRDPANDLLIERDRVYFGMGGTSEPMFWDYALSRPRQPVKADMETSTRIGHALQNIDFAQTICMSGDKPTGQIFFHDFDAIFRNTTKPTVLNILERPFTELMLGLAAAASGGEQEL
jgi:trimethylamine---corrinoid protein Co-methyltransferase